MNERIAQYREKISQYWNHFTRKQKTLLISTIAIILVAVILLTMQFSKTQYEVAFTGLDSSDAAGIITYLESSSIPYKLSADGKSISVPSTDAAKAKVDVGSQGIVQNGSLGFAGTFGSSNSAIGMTENEFKVKYKSALNGEVEQLLTKMQGVSSAKVLINLPAEKMFATEDEQEKASASGVISFKPGYHPDQAAINGYYNLMKTAVPNLPIANITLSDTSGEELSGPDSNGNNGGLQAQVNTNMALQKKFESDVRLAVQQFLGKLTGPDKVNVLVASKLNFDQVSEKSNLVTPVDVDNMKGIEISAQKIQKSYTGKGADQGGVTGTGETEVPGYPGSSNTSNTSSEDNTSTINYEVNRITKEVVQAPYTVKDLTINVMVEPPAGKNSLDDQTQGEIKNVLKNIVGSYLADSGSTYTDADLLKKVSVLSQAFSQDSVENTGWLANSKLWWGLGIAALVIAAGITLLVVRRRRRREQEEFEEDVPLSMPTEFPSITLESVTNDSQVRKQLETLAKKKPDEFVNLLRTWLADE
ncbi:flagellar M-ring protein FliF [Paenibacillus shirakamiensis]|uniref:Flagellar M-ring protein n=1 Tax=Paenibacillus shirakamiensis TaxID=1265935 RepID=A0ABS4JHD7_9BACL|nr:flagellar M-ring protein FliF [Paenibacillus shirakamiensis]